MPKQESIPVAANVLGTIGTVFWCVQLVPQIWRNWRTKDTEGLPALMMFIWALSGVPFGVYAIVQQLNIPIQVQAQIFMCLSLISWGQCLHYKNAWRRWTSIAALFTFGIFCAGVEAALILTLRPLYNRGIEWPMLVIGIIAAILLAAGLVPPYFEIWKRRGQVIGIDWLFLCIDWSGAFFSLMSLVAQNTFDYLGGVMYIVVLLLESGIFTSHAIWLLRTRKQRREQKNNSDPECPGANENTIENNNESEKA
ncbi:hypothetical protein RUND412_005462 [Rhizina undulata]